MHTNIEIFGLIFQATPSCTRHSPVHTWWLKLHSIRTSSTMRTSQGLLLYVKISSGECSWDFQLLLQFAVLFAWLLSSCYLLLISLPLGSQVIAVPVNSSLSWHMNRLRDPSRDAYNVSYAWKLVRYSFIGPQMLAYNSLREN